MHSAPTSADLNRPPLALETLAALDDAALEEALAVLPTAQAADLIARAPTLEEKTRLLWALDDGPRRQALSLSPAPLVAALIENLTEDNCYLLGDLDLASFRRLLELCSPEQRYYWLETCLSFTDARANALPFFCDPGELAEALLTRPGFAEHIRALVDYPIEDRRLPPEMMVDPARALLYLFGEDRLLQEFPVADESLRKLLQTLLDWDVDCYTEIIRATLRRLDYQASHLDEQAALVEEPVLLDHLEPPPPSPPSALPVEARSLVLAPVGRSSLLRAAQAHLAPERRQAVRQAVQALCLREAIAAGGSFRREVLERIAASAEAYLTLGLRALSAAEPGAAARQLSETSVEYVRERGALEVERLRQIALRLAPHVEVLDERQQALVQTLLRPRLRLSSEDEPLLICRGGGGLPATLPPEEAPGMLRDVSAWIELARALKFRRVAPVLATATPADRVALLAALSVGATLYGRIEIGLAEPADFRAFAERYLTPAKRRPSRRAWRRVRQALLKWEAGAALDPEATMRQLSLGMERVGELARAGGLNVATLRAGGYLPPTSAEAD